MEPIGKAENEKYELKIFQDEDARNPRREGDYQLSTMAFFHGRYDLGDETQFRNPAELDAWLRKNKRNIVLLQLVYMMDHSGLSISTDRSQFAAWDPQGWDWGMIGYVFTTKAKIREQFMVKKVTKRVLERAAKNIDAEIEEYDSYLRGEVYGFVLTDKTRDDDDPYKEDSCWNFIGELKKSGIADHLPEDAKPLLEMLQ